MINIGIIYPTFQKAKLVFEEIEKIIPPDNKIVKVSHGADEYAMTTPFFKIWAMPMSDKVRGFRFHHIITDYHDTWTKERFEAIVLPMISAKGTSVIQYTPQRKDEHPKNWRDLDDGCQGNL